VIGTRRSGSARTRRKRSVVDVTDRLARGAARVRPRPPAQVHLEGAVPVADDVPQLPETVLPRVPRAHASDGEGPEPASGECVDVDYVGDPLECVDVRTREIHRAWVFIAALRCSRSPERPTT